MLKCVSLKGSHRSPSMTSFLQTRHWEESEELREMCQCDKKFMDRGEGEVRD